MKLGNSEMVAASSFQEAKSPEVKNLSHRETDALPQEIKPKRETDALPREIKSKGVGEVKRDAGKERGERIAGGPRQEMVDGIAHYYDDNGELYRVGNDLKPNAEYTINGYQYFTDRKGRISRVKGILHLKEREERLPIRDSLEDIGKGDQKEGDDRGHVIGDQFDGSNGLENMIPQNAELNRGDFKKLENQLAKEVKDGKEVRVEINVVYEGDSRRPSEIRVIASVDGKIRTQTFRNR
jgi:hypothetical protein